MPHLASFLGEITVRVVVGVLGEVGAGVHGLDPVQENHQTRAGETLK